ncbi:MAG: hypothetical protein Alpg2KO_00850 [Alphaproteobacteria bacterium]
MSTKINIILALEGLAALRNGMAKVGNGVEAMNRGLGQARNTALGVTASLTAIGVASVNSAAGLEQSLSNVEAKSGATADQMQRLKDQAIELGGSTKFSAQQAADGMGFLAQAGFEAGEILTAMPAMLDLAAAGQLDLARAADIASNVLSGFGFEADQAARVADVMAQAAAKSNVSVEQLGLTMQYVAPVAKTAGVSLEQAATFAGMLGNAGIQGEKAGTALRAAIANLSAPATAGSNALAEIGVSTQDANGNLRDMTDILTEMQVAMSNLGTADQTRVAKDVFGLEAAPAMLELMTQTQSGGIAEMRQQMDQATGAAANMAAMMSDNLSGDITALGSAFDSLKTAIGDELLGTVREAVQWFTELIRAFTALDGETRKQIIRWAMIAGVVALGVVAISILGLALGGIIAFFGVLGTIAAAVWAIVFSPITIIAAAIIALAALIYRNWDEIKAETARLWEGVEILIQQFIDWFKESFPALATFLSEVWDQIKDTALLAWEVVKTGVSAVIEAIRSVFSAFWDWFSEQFPVLAIQLEAFADKITGFFSTAFETIRSTVGKVIDWIKTQIDKAIGAIKGAVDKVKGFIGGLPSLGGSDEDGDGGGFFSRLGFARGGLVRGPGSGTSDSIAARLSNGEFVMRASAVQRWGVGLMQQLNQGLAPTQLAPSMAGGGSVRDTSGDTVIIPINGRRFTLQADQGVGRELQREIERDERREL